MNLSLNKLLQWLILTLIFPLVFLNGWLGLKIFQYFQPLITTFILAILLAFILNFPVSVLQRHGFKRANAVALVFLSSLVIIAGLGITLVPIFLEQFSEMVNLLPRWIESGEEKLQFFSSWAVSHGFKFNLSEIFRQIADRLPNELSYIADKTFSVVLHAFDSISEALITVVLTVYLLLDGDRIWQSIFKKLPLNVAKGLQYSLQQNFQNFLIGQIALASLVGVSMTVMFLVLQVPFGLVFGLGIGLFSLIPFGDVLSLAVITLILASHNFWLGVKVAAIATIIDQIIDQAIAPRLLGSFTGLRPIWVLVSLLVGTYIAGLLGLLIAVPLAGVIKDAAEGWEEMPNLGFSNNAGKLPGKQNSGELGEETPGMLPNESTSQ